VPGVWGNTLSFLGGPHACIGYKFSLYETKLILHALLSTFEVELAVPAAEIGETRGIVTRWRQNDAYITGGVHVQHELHEVLRLQTWAGGPMGSTRTAQVLGFQ
jgi:hypothetical protein